MLLTTGWEKAETFGVLFGTVGTLAAVGVSLFLVFRERSDRAEDARARKEFQARRVTVFPKWVSAQGADPINVNYKIQLRNQSDEAVTDIYLRAWVVDAQGHEFPGQEPLVIPETVPLGPGDAADPPARWQLPQGEDGNAVKHQVRAVLEFTDALGVRWRRSSEGNRLREIENREPAPS